MDNRTHVAFKANDRSYFAILKKEIRAIAFSANINEHRVAEIDIIVAEMVSNLVKHAGGGQLLVKPVEENGMQGIEIISIDNGGGMTDITRMVADGVSTKNTLGQGLGAMKRLSNVFQVFSQKDWGTVILVRIFEEPIPPFMKPGKAEIKSVILPKPGEVECGDGFYYSITNRHIKLFLGDGLGHGSEAAKAVSAAGEAFLQCKDEDPSDIIRFINAEVKKTRGQFSQLHGTLVRQNQIQFIHQSNPRYFMHNHKFILHAATDISSVWRAKSLNNEEVNIERS